MTRDYLDVTQYGCKLGIQEMPPGYRLDRLDSGHYYWVLEVGEPDENGVRGHCEEGTINWDRWAVYRDAREDSKRYRLRTGSWEDVVAERAKEREAKGARRE